MAQRGFLCCDLGGGQVAIPLERVIGVVEEGVVTPLPYSARSFEGLVEAFGQIVPQLDLASLLSLPSTEGGFLVVVSEHDGSIALRVAHVTGMVQVDRDALTGSAALARERHPFYSAHFEYERVNYHVLDLDRLDTSEVLELVPAEGATLLPEARIAIRKEPEQEWIPLLLLEIDGERYAVPNSSIVELNTIGHLRSMPDAPSWILGLIDLRGRPLIAVSTAALLGRADRPSDVCLIADLEEGFPVALIVDRALGLERVSPALIRPMQESMAGITGYFVRGEGQIVGVIDPQKLLSQVVTPLRAAIPQDARVTSEVSQTENLRRTGETQRLLSLRVGHETYALDLDRIERILASVVLTPLPSDISFFDGMADVGDALVPVIDLRRQQGTALQAFDSTQRPTCILTMLEGAMTGIIVDQVLSILDVPLESFEAVTEASRLPISHVVAWEGQLIAILTIDRLLPPSGVAARSLVGQAHG